MKYCVMAVGQPSTKKLPSFKLSCNIQEIFDHKYSYILKLNFYDKTNFDRVIVLCTSLSQYSVDL